MHRCEAALCYLAQTPFCLWGGGGEVTVGDHSKQFHVIQSLESGKHEKVASFPCRGRKYLRVYSWYSLPDLQHDQIPFIRISSLSVPEIRPLGTF